MELLAARIGTTLSYCQPYTPTGKAKIERWFRTMKDQWMAGLDMRQFHSLEELKGSLFAFVHQYNLTVHSSLHGKSPQDRFFSEPEQIRRSRRMRSTRSSCWRSRGASPPTASSPSTRWNMKSITGSPGSASGSVIPMTCGRSLWWNPMGTSHPSACSINTKTLSSNAKRHAYAKETIKWTTLPAMGLTRDLVSSKTQKTSLWKHRNLRNSVSVWTTFFPHVASGCSPAAPGGKNNRHPQLGPKPESFPL